MRGGHQAAPADHRQRRNTVGLVVEGEAEFRALPLLHTERLLAGCPPLKPRNVGGIGGDVSPAGIAFRAHKAVLGLFASGAVRVAVCLDRERREACPGELAHLVWKELDRLLVEKGGSGRDVDVVVADRAFEAWILADATGLHARGLLKTAPKFRSFEGRLGTRKGLGKRELTQLLGREYRETRDGPRLFAHLDFAAARAHGSAGNGSKSLDKLLRVLGI